MARELGRCFLFPHWESGVDGGWMMPCVGLLSAINVLFLDPVGGNMDIFSS